MNPVEGGASQLDRALARAQRERQRRGRPPLAVGEQGEEDPAYHYLDLVPKGRDEAGLPWPMAWLKIRDQYGE